jgi:hypothetical protein
MLVETLRADWAARGTNARVSALPGFANGALILGAGTKLAEARGERRDDAAESECAVALVSVAIGRPLDASTATHVRRALAKAREGDAPLALTHLALAGVGRLGDPREDARRLFIADGLMKAGVPPATILAALGDAPPPDALDRAYNPDQPRVPAGNGRPSGQWTSGDWEDDGGSDDASAPTSASNDVVSGRSQSVQISDASNDWTQHLNPIASAEAAQAGASPFNGVGPYTQHQLGVAAAIAHYEALGYVIFSRTATAVDVPGFASPRVYDFVVQSPDGLLIGVEVKTTMGDTIFLKPIQVAKDVTLMLDGGGVARVSGASIRGVAYTTYCRYCDKIDIRGAVLYGLLKFANIAFSYDQLP